MRLLLKISGVLNGALKNASTNLKISEIFAIIIIENERGIDYEFKLLEICFYVRERVSCTL